jgi:Xaa-Pro aminopeptidase
MKTDLDNLMAAQNLDAILITGPAQHNPAMVYMTGGAHLTGADLIKKRGEEPMLFCYPMERDEAARTGLITRNLADYKINDLLKEAGGDLIKATAARYQMMFHDLGIHSGRLGIYGQLDAGMSYAVFSTLQQAIPELTLVGEAGKSILMQAMMTKDATEIERIRRMGKITTTVVGRVAEYLSSHAGENGVLVDHNGQPLNIGHVKSRINLWLAELGADNPEGTIFAIGRDAGVPHSSGTSSDLLRLGETIVFDIFPCEASGGYFYDFTRTWCLGYATDAQQALYNDVLTVYQTIMQELRVGVPFKNYQQRTCEIFESRGHPTVLSNPTTECGYVHSLGHGLGLHVHELPRSGIAASEAEQLDPGVVITIEPGLYYPDKGMGVRLEDSVVVHDDGRFEILAPYPLDLIIPVKQKRIKRSPKKVRIDRTLG